MTAEVCFTCRPHFALARDQDGGRTDIRRVWCVATAPEASYALQWAPPGVEVWHTPFERAGNLNGWACLAGMVGVWRRLVAAGAGLIVKRDSDTRVLDYAALVPPDGSPGVGVAKPTYAPWDAFGSCYSLTSAGVEAVAALVAARDFPADLTPARGVPEDRAISWALRDRWTILPPARAHFVRGGGGPLSGAAWSNARNRWASAIAPPESA